MFYTVYESSIKSYTVDRKFDIHAKEKKLVTMQKPTSSQYVRYKFSRHHKHFMSDIWILYWNIHGWLTDFDNWMDHFASYGSNDEKNERQWQSTHLFWSTSHVQAIIGQTVDKCTSCTYAKPHTNSLNEWEILNLWIWTLKKNLTQELSQSEWERL